MYILVFEDGSIKQAEKVGEGDLSCADDGLLDIVDVSGPVLQQYYNGKWHLLEDV